MKHKGPETHPCLDCKGSGVYQGLGAPEDCKTCGGAGAFIGIVVDLPNDIYPKGTKKEDWDQLADAFKKSGEEFLHHAGDVTLIKGKGAPDLQVGESVHVFDSGWFDTVVDSFYVTSSNRTMVRVSYTCGTMQIPVQDICWNITEDRWEYIRCGTPVW